MTSPPAQSPAPSPGEHANPLQPVLFEVKHTIVGQDVLLERMAIALLSGGHLLVEGVPGLAKTLLVASLAETLDLSLFVSDGPATAAGVFTMRHLRPGCLRPQSVT